MNLQMIDAGGLSNFVKSHTDEIQIQIESKCCVH